MKDNKIKTEEMKINMCSCYIYNIYIYIYIYQFITNIKYLKMENLQAKINRLKETFFKALLTRRK